MIPAGAMGMIPQQAIAFAYPVPGMVLPQQMQMRPGMPGMFPAPQSGMFPPNPAQMLVDPFAMLNLGGMNRGFG